MGWFTWALSVTAAASNNWFIGSELKAGKADVLDFCSDLSESEPSVAVVWCALCEFSCENVTTRFALQPAIIASKIAIYGRKGTPR